MFWAIITKNGKLLVDSESKHAMIFTSFKAAVSKMKDYPSSDYVTECIIGPPLGVW